jgi:hypothetical protein
MHGKYEEDKAGALFGSHPPAQRLCHLSINFQGPAERNALKTAPKLLDVCSSASRTSGSSKALVAGTYPPGDEVEQHKVLHDGLIVPVDEM